MKTFLIETVDNQLQFDFAFHLVDAVKHQNWLYGEPMYDIVYSEKEDKWNYKDYIPVGSLEFVFNHIEQYYGKSKDSIKPINIPQELMQPEFLKREVKISNKKDIILSGKHFIKSHDRYKGFTEMVSDITIMPEGNYIVSDCIEIHSEWRAFIIQGKLVGLQNYLGDFTLFPDVPLIKKMINHYKNSPLSYTLDVGINATGTFIIEVHPFVSCGLYGFSDYKHLPIMFIQGFNYLLKQ